MIDQAGIKIAQGHSIACERINGVNDNMTKSHFHNYFELYYLETGERYHMINDELYCIHSNEFILFAPYVMHHSYGNENVSFKRILVYFNPEEIQYTKVLNELETRTGVYKTDIKSNIGIYRLLENLLNEENNPSVFSDEYKHTLLNMLVLLITRLNKPMAKPEKSTRIGNIISYIHEHYNEDITLEHLSQISFISQYYLCREFKYITNSTIIQYLNTTRIMNAQRKIMETNKNFTEISKETGFCNVTHFNRVFKKTTGMTPSEYKKSYYKNNKLKKES